MKNTKQLILKRRGQLYNTICNNPDLGIGELASILDTSEITIRRDLQILQNEKKIELHYGGFSILKPNPIDLKERCKNQIARYAAKFVEDDDIIFINTSSTAISLIPYISAKNVTVITNNGNAINMDFPHSVSVYLTGGEIRHPKASLVGDLVLKTIKDMRVHKSFIGCTGISATEGMTTKNANEVSINAMMIENTRICSYILADFTKFEVMGYFVSCPPTSLRNIITDENVPEEVVRGFTDLGIKVYIAGKSNQEKR